MNASPLAVESGEAPHVVGHPLIGREEIEGAIEDHKLATEPTRENGALLIEALAAHPRCMPQLAGQRVEDLVDWAVGRLAVRELIKPQPALADPQPALADPRITVIAQKVWERMGGADEAPEIVADTLLTTLEVVSGEDDEVLESYIEDLADTLVPLVESPLKAENERLIQELAVDEWYEADDVGLDVQHAATYVKGFARALRLIAWSDGQTEHGERLTFNLMLQAERELFDVAKEMIDDGL